MSTEERLARDIEAVTRGVVVAESDLRDARAGIEDRIGNGRPDRRRTVVAAAAAAVIVFVLGVAAFLTLGGDDTAAPPANAGPSPAPSPGINDHAEFLAGEAPTPEGVQGIWRLDNGGVLMRFAPPNLVSFDREGRLFEGPGAQGRYLIQGDRIIISVDGGPYACGGQQIAMRASLPKTGEMRFVYTQPGTGKCYAAMDERWVMEQVLPASPIIASYDNSQADDWLPLNDERALHGTWFAEGGGYVLELGRGGVYHVVTGSGEQVDYGGWELEGSQLTLTSWPDSVECSTNDRLVLGALEYTSPGTTAIRSVVRENTCGGEWADKAWVLVPDEGN
ncbi:MAG TPA: hypothetical protein VK640_10515 [Actinomycetes bacterium]|nr:hypothetical protein [Actinomycetes bacterium]